MAFDINYKLTQEGHLVGHPDDHYPKINIKIFIN